MKNGSGASLNRQHLWYSMTPLMTSIDVPRDIEDVSGSKNRFQWERPCKNLGEVRSLVHELNIAGASKGNFVIDRLLSDVEVRLRRTFHLIWLPPSYAHPRWACMVFIIKVESSTRPASSRQKPSPIIRHKCLLESCIANYACVENLYQDHQ